VSVISTGAIQSREALDMIHRKTVITAAAVCWAFAAGSVFAADNAMKSDQPVTDSVITTKVKAELAKDKATKAHEIHVTTKDGIVMLDGAVTSEAEKEKAETDAKTIKGVVSVQNNLRVAEK
jgi:hyperosmotically inducible protein